MNNSKLTNTFRPCNCKNHLTTHGSSKCQVKILIFQKLTKHFGNGPLTEHYTNGSQDRGQYSFF